MHRWWWFYRIDAFRQVVLSDGSIYLGGSVDQAHRMGWLCQCGTPRGFSCGFSSRLCRHALKRHGAARARRPRPLRTIRRPDLPARIHCENAYLYQICASGPGRGQGKGSAWRLRGTGAHGDAISRGTISLGGGLGWAARRTRTARRAAVITFGRMHKRTVRLARHAPVTEPIARGGRPARGTRAQAGVPIKRPRLARNASGPLRPLAAGTAAGPRWRTSRGPRCSAS